MNRKMSPPFQLAEASNKQGISGGYISLTEDQTYAKCLGCRNSQSYAEMHEWIETNKWEE